MRIPPFLKVTFPLAFFCAFIGIRLATCVADVRPLLGAGGLFVHVFAKATTFVPAASLKDVKEGRRIL